MKRLKCCVALFLSLVFGLSGVLQPFALYAETLDLAQEQPKVSQPATESASNASTNTSGDQVESDSAAQDPSTPDSGEATDAEAHENKDFGTIVTNVVNFGSQIPQEARSDIFRRFVKGKTGPGTESGGTGLGLSIARWAAQLHGGSVRVVDDPRGADFEIILPKYHVTDDE